MKEFTEKVVVYITKEQKAWVQSLPKSYNLSEKLRNYLEKLKKLKTE